MMDFVHSIFTVETVKQILLVAEIFFVIYLTIYSSFLFSSVIVGSNQLFTDIKKRQLHNAIHHDYYVPISIIVPAYNEEVTIKQTITSLLNLNYAHYEIVIVNDGSKDATAETVIKAFDLHQGMRSIRCVVESKEVTSIYEGTIEGVEITLINKENGGKADSINMGINVSKYPYFVCMDADSILERDSLKNLAVPVLENQNVIAVASMVRISNDSVFDRNGLVELRMPKRLVPAFQVLEYERSFLAARIFLDKFNSNMIVSGAFGLFLKEAVINVGGYQIGSMGEDMELIVKLHAFYKSNKLPYKIKYAYDSVCWTQAPEHLGDLLKQRKRWHIGLMQSLLGHPSMALNLGYQYFMLFELLSPIIELLGILITLLAFAFKLLNIKYMIILFVVYALFGSLLTIISYLARNFLSDIRIRKRDVLKACLLCVPENMFLRFVLAWTRMFSIFFYRGKKTNWGKIKRYNIHYKTDTK